MKRFTSRLVLVLALVALVGVSVSKAEVTISVTITGSIDELLPILRQLQAIGYGGEESGDPLKLRVHSIMTGEESGETVPAPASQPSEEPAPLGFQGASVQPAAAKVGETVLFTARVSDPDHVVDTVALTVGDITFDLFDNGANGDAKAMDGAWSRNYELPASLAPGEHVASITAYDVNGDAVKIWTQPQVSEPMTTEVSFTVTQ